MPAAQIASNKATFAHLHDAVNSGDTELISKTIYEVFDRGVPPTDKSVTYLRFG